MEQKHPIPWVVSQGEEPQKQRCRYEALKQGTGYAHLQDERRQWWSRQFGGLCPEHEDSTTRSCLLDPQGQRGEFPVPN